ncbi:DUF4230 domain-containing protein [Cruoricaptor ignavus]|uniref:DUF4230 domain-containing protein n=1 Tax=Cruoricaptor ignavus TaxID=1118202 RepID=UPI00370D0E6B
MKNAKYWVWGLGIAAVLVLSYFIYQMGQGNQNLTILIMLLIGLLLGGLIVFLISGKKSEPPVVLESSHTVIESMRKVFKIVSAEGQFNEIYNYEEQSKLLRVIPQTKKALVIVKAKVLVGYDFEKFKWAVDEENRKIRLLEFPAPEILSTETDYKYYNIEEQPFNLFSKEDLARIQENGKMQVIEAAKNSDLPRIAAEQMQTMLTELVRSNHFVLENPEKISESRKKIGFDAVVSENTENIEA